MAEIWRYRYPMTRFVQQALLRKRPAVGSSGLLAAALALGAMAGCATPRFETFPQALHSCRQMQPGRSLWKSHRPSTYPLVAECLERHGWAPDGSRTEK